jgi:competence protein CoiA
MKYALVDGERQEAQPGCPGVCPACSSPMVARCGDVRVYHWSHRGRRNCDIWWENETEWHRNWKNRFPANWQEIVHPGENGERHIADVKTDQGWVLEFQHSKIHSDERKTREAFYEKLVWVVDGSRRKRDKAQFFDALLSISEAPNLFRMIPKSSTLLQDWADSTKSVLFDFSGSDEAESTQLWCLFKVVKGIAYVGQLSRDDFIKYHSPEGEMNIRDFLEFWGDINSRIEGIIYREEFYQSRQAVLSDPLVTMTRRPVRLQRSRRL